MAGKQTRKSLTTWIREAMTDTEKDGPCAMMSLVHMVGLQREEVHTVRFGTKEWTPEALSEMFSNKANAFSQDLPGVQTFKVLAFYKGRDGNCKSEHEASHHILANQNFENQDLVTEAPDDRGRTQMTMRHGEMLMQQVYRRQEVLDNYTLRLIEHQGNMIAKLSKENSDAFEIVKEMLMKKALDDHEHRMKELQFTRSAEERKKLLQFAPALINSILGKEVFPQSTADTALVEAIADNIAEEDIVKLSGIVPPQLLGPLAARMAEHEEKKRREKENLELAKQLVPHVDPEASARGDT